MIRKANRKKRNVAVKMDGAIGFPKRLFVFFVFAGVAYGLYANWAELLRKLDSEPISAFAFVGNKPNYTTTEDIRLRLLELEPLGGYFSQDVKKIQQHIEALSWIERAWVKKIWPNKLSVAVVEYIPRAVWNDKQAIAYNGNVLDIPEEKFALLDLPYLYGDVQQSQIMITGLEQMNTILNRLSLSVTALYLNERGAWQVTLSNGVKLKLGTGEWQSKLERLLAIYAYIEVPKYQQIDYIDLRYRSGFAVSFKALAIEDNLSN